VGESVLTRAYARVDGALACEGVPLSTIAQAVGTPTYVYSANAVREQYTRLAAALHGVPFRIHYSLKANSNLALLRLLRSLGSAADVVSAGELYRARRAGFAPADIIFGGVGKTEREIADGLDAGVLLLNVESEDELRIVDRLAGERGMVAPVAIRVNPEITVETPHSYIRTGEKGHKFGIPYDEVRDVARVAGALPNVVLRGLDMHVGSQLSRAARAASLRWRRSAPVPRHRRGPRGHVRRRGADRPRALCGDRRTRGPLDGAGVDRRAGSIHGW
jgi:diaminopimelate decarboxylase